LSINPGSEEALAVQFRDDPDQHRYVAEVDGRVVAIAVYQLRAGRHIFVHTEVNSAHGGKGVGAALARFALDDVKAQGGNVVPLCPFIAAWIKRHPDYEAIVDHELLDRINGVKRDR
jgi:predicted GNAT family acetyltransferase